MKFSHTCASCNRTILLTYDETDATPEFCPFCGEPVDDNALSDYDDAPGIKGANDPDNWGDDDDR